MTRRRYTYLDYRDSYGQQDDHPHGGFLRSVTDVMVAFWRLAVMKRMMGSSNRPIMNGDEFIKQIQPEFVGITFYRLEHYRQEFRYLAENGWLIERTLNTPQRGFGNDEGFLLTEAAYRFIMAVGENDLFTAFYQHFDRDWQER